MTTTERISPIECTAWCTQADGHPDEIFREDQTCFGPSAYVPVTKNDHLQVSGPDQRIGVMAYRQPGLQPCVYVHLDGIDIAPHRDDQILDDTVHLTALEAFDLATALMDTIRTLTGEPKGDRPTLRITVPPEAAGD